VEGAHSISLGMTAQTRGAEELPLLYSDDIWQRMCPIVARLSAGI